MATIKDGYYPYKDYKYDGDQDAYELMSKWTSSDTVYLPNNTTNLTTKLNAIDSTLDGIVDDVTLSSSTTWSSTKISNELSALSAIIDEKAAIQYQVIPAMSTLTVDIFEGFFTLSRSSTVVAGVIDRWGENVGYIVGPTQELNVGITVDGGQNKVVFRNNTNAYALVMYVDNGHEFI